MPVLQVEVFVPRVIEARVVGAAGHWVLEALGFRVDGQHSDEVAALGVDVADCEACHDFLVCV